MTTRLWNPDVTTAGRTCATCGTPASSHKLLGGAWPTECPVSNEQKIAAARAMRQSGASLFEIATALNVSKEWLRTYAGLAS